MTWEEIADHAGAAYLRYSFTRGTDQEVDFLVEALGLQPGDRLLDVGCGPGRHCHALAARGISAFGVDRAESFLHAGRRLGPGPSFVRADARRLPVAGECVDAVICLCQGGFGLLGGGDDETAALAAMSACLRPGGRLALTAFSAYFAAAHMEEGETLDAATGVLTEPTTVRGEAGGDRQFRLSSTCFTPRELRLMANACGLDIDGIWSVAPGRYGRRQPEVGLPEFLVVAQRPSATLMLR